MKFRAFALTHWRPRFELQRFAFGADTQGITNACSRLSVAEIECISVKKVLSVLVNSNHIIQPRRSHYDIGKEVDEFWTYVGSKKNKMWLIYAYHRATGEILAFVWGNRNKKTARRLREKMTSLNVSFDTIYTDDWDSLKNVFLLTITLLEKRTHKGLRGNNCRFVTPHS